MFDLGVILGREIRSLSLLEMKRPEDKLKWNHSAEFLSYGEATVWWKSLSVWYKRSSFSEIVMLD